LIKDLPGVQDVFCGPLTVVHMKRGSASLSPDALEAVFADYEIACDGIERDDTAML
jgi:hypothetical protein